MRAVSPALAVLAAALLAGGAAPTPARADDASVFKILLDCTDDEVLEGHYTQAQLREALANMADDQAQYLNCEEVIARAAYAQAGGAKPRRGRSAPAPTGEFGGFGAKPQRGTDPAAAASPRERAMVDRASGRPAPLRLSGGAVVAPDVRAGFAPARVPGPLRLVLLAIALGAAGALLRRSRRSA
jgi:hypothetical protein